jgi:hypothetical protein
VASLPAAGLAREAVALAGLQRAASARQRLDPVVRLARPVRGLRAERGADAEMIATRPKLPAGAGTEAPAAPAAHGLSAPGRPSDLIVDAGPSGRAMRVEQEAAADGDRAAMKVLAAKARGRARRSVAATSDVRARRTPMVRRADAAQRLA